MNEAEALLRLLPSDVEVEDQDTQDDYFGSVDSDEETRKCIILYTLQ